MNLRLYVPGGDESFDEPRRVARSGDAVPTPARFRALRRLRAANSARAAVGTNFRPAAGMPRAAVAKPVGGGETAPVSAGSPPDIAAIVAQVMESMKGPAVVVPSLQTFLDSVALPAVPKKIERDARSLSVRRLLERVGFCGRCRVSWRMDSGAGEKCQRCGDARMTDPGIDLVDSAALACLAASLLDDELSPGTVKKQVTYLMAVLNKAAELNVCRKVRKPRIRQVESVIRVLSEAELLALYRACDQARWPRHAEFTAPDWWRAFFVVALVYGMRLGELTSLPWSESAGAKKLARGLHAAPECPHPELRHLDLKSQHGWLVYLPAKQSDAKPLPLVLPVRDVVASHLDRIRGKRHFVFDCYSELKSHKPGDYRDVKISLYRQWDALCESAGIELRATPHDLRRTQETRFDNQFGKGIGGEVNGHAARSVSDSYYSQAVPRIHKAVLGVTLPTFGG